MKPTPKALTLVEHFFRIGAGNNGNVFKIEPLTLNDLVIETEKPEGYLNSFLENKQRQGRKKR